MVVASPPVARTGAKGAIDAGLEELGLRDKLLRKGLGSAGGADVAALFSMRAIPGMPHRVRILGIVNAFIGAINAAEWVNGCARL